MERIKTMQRKKHSAEFKAKIVLEAAKGLKTINYLSRKSGGTSNPSDSMEETIAR
jgi:transposase-like protein